ncbi:hypothetical protein J6590_101281, partial [Homalodisca vitripennis]
EFPTWCSLKPLRARGLCRRPIYDSTHHLGSPHPLWVSGLWEILDNGIYLPLKFPVSENLQSQAIASGIVWSAASLSLLKYEENLSSFNI